MANAAMTAMTFLQRLDELIRLCDYASAQMRFPSEKVLKNPHAGTPDAPITKLGALRGVLTSLQSEFILHDNELSLMATSDVSFSSDDFGTVLGECRQAIIQFQDILRGNVAEEEGLLNRMRKVVVSGPTPVARTVNDACKVLVHQRIVLQLCLTLITNWLSANAIREPQQVQGRVNLDEPPQYTFSGDPRASETIAGSSSNASEPPAYDSVKAVSRSLPLARPKRKIHAEKGAEKAIYRSTEAVPAERATPIESKFIRAVKNKANSVAELAKLCANSANIDACDADSSTALQASIARKQPEIVQWLLERGANPNMEGGDAGTALKRAAAADNMEIVMLLLKGGADPSIDEGDDYNGNALENADPAIFDLLLSRGASPHTPQTFHTAIKKGKLWMVEKLLDAGADIEMRWSMYPYSPINTAMYYGDQDMLRLLLSYGANPDAPATGCGPSASTYTPILAAIYGGQVDQIRTLLQHGADPGKFKHLQCAALSGQTMIVKLLIEDFGVDINRKAESDGATAICAAATYGREETIKYLLSRNADAIIQDCTRNTPLQCAANKGHSCSVAVLLGAPGADPMADGLLHGAISNGNYIMLDLLLGAGANINASARAGKYSKRKEGRITPLELAIDRGNDKMVAYLISCGAIIDGLIRPFERQEPPLLYAIECQQASIVRILLNWDVEPHAVVALGNAARTGSLPVVKELVTNFTCRKGHPVSLATITEAIRGGLWEAQQKGYQDIVDYLQPMSKA